MAYCGGPSAQLQVVDQGITTLSWSGTVAYIPLTQAIDPSKHMAMVLYAGGGVAGMESYYFWLEANRIVVNCLRSDGSGYAVPVSWQVVKVPTGKVQRGHTTVNANGTTDIVLPESINLAAAMLNLCHQGRFLGANFEGSVFVNGNLRKHATDASKLQSVLVGPTGTIPFSWEVWNQ